MRKVLTILVMLFAVAVADAAPVFVAARGGTIYGTTTATSSSFAPTANNGLIGFLLDFSNAAETLTASGTGTYSLVTPPGNATSANYGETAVLWTNPAASSSSQTMTATTGGSGDHVGAVLLEYSGVNNNALGIIQNSGGNTSNITAVSTPGTGAGAIAGAPMFVPTGATLVAMCWDNSGSTEPTAGNGTSRATGQFTSASSAYVVEDFSGASATITPTCTSTAGATDYFTVIQAILYPPGLYTAQFMQGGEGVSPETVVMPSPVTSGAGVVVAVIAGWTNGGGSPTCTVADNKSSGNYTLANFYYDSTTTYFGGEYYKVPNATGTPTITATCSVGTLFVAGSQVVGFVGTPTVDATASTESFSHSAVSTQTGSVSSGHSNEMLFAAPWSSDSLMGFVSGWTSYGQSIPTSDANYLSANIPSAQADNFSGTLTGASTTLTVFSGIYDNSGAATPAQGGFALSPSN